MDYKKGFSLVELIFILLLVGLIYSFSTSSQSTSKLALLKQQLILHLKFMRYIAFNDNFFDNDDALYYRKYWTFKVLNCSNNQGFYYVIYSDSDQNGYISKTEALKDPLTNKYIYNYYKCVDDEFDKLANTLLTKTFGVKNIQISCNDTTSIGQISFSNDGKVYTKLDKYNLDKYKLDQNCYITFSNDTESQTITISKNGYIF